MLGKFIEENFYLFLLDLGRKANEKFLNLDPLESLLKALWRSLCQ